MIQQISLEEAARILNEWWIDPSSKDLAGTSLTPDSLSDRAREAGYRVDVEPIASWEGRTDLDMYEELSRRAGPFSGEILLITEASFNPDVGAFRLDVKQMQLALEEHQSRFEPVFNGDVIIATLKDRRIICVHHENYLIVMTPSGSDACPRVT